MLSHVHCFPFASLLLLFYFTFLLVGCLFFFSPLLSSLLLSLYLSLFRSSSSFVNVKWGYKWVELELFYAVYFHCFIFSLSLFFCTILQFFSLSLCSSFLKRKVNKLINKKKKKGQRCAMFSYHPISFLLFSIILVACIILFVPFFPFPSPSHTRKISVHNIVFSTSSLCIILDYHYCDFFFQHFR